MCVCACVKTDGMYSSTYMKFTATGNSSCPVDRGVPELPRAVLVVTVTSVPGVDDAMALQ